MHSADESARLLGELLEATSQETGQIALLIHQHGTTVFWDRLEDWRLPAELGEKLLAVKHVLQVMTTAAAERSAPDAPGPFR
ncbi:hypothetical protein [Paenibacillus sp. S150]|uniref:hypothetical protein n=1 Tax=Paenibacillus sp. S150 TaxID=2749826 RepID=UPI001C565068|nr:hypothetical protein [Paenibacillus sp. S150]MBW4085260.1 hypothetical protein [Paenibacillus sp. S150]